MLEAIVLAICIKGSTEACTVATEQWYSQWPYRKEIERRKNRLTHKYPILVFVTSGATAIYKKELVIYITRNVHASIKKDEAALVWSWDF